MSKNYAAALVAAAQELGLELKEDQEAFELGETLGLISTADSAGFRAMETAGAHQERIERSRDVISQLDAIFPVGGFFEGHKAAIGSHRGCKVMLIPRVKNEVSRVIVVVMLNEPLQCNLHIYSETLGSRLGKFFFRVQDLQLGHPQLDPLVMVKAENVADATRCLSGTAVQDALLAVYKSGSGSPVCNDISVRATVEDGATSQQLVDWVERLTELALAF